MCTIDYEARQHRLRVAGRCGGGEAAVAIREAIGTFGRGLPRLIIDLTAVTELPEEVAAAIVAAGAEIEPCEVTVVRKHGSDVDRRLTDAGRG